MDQMIEGWMKSLEHDPAAVHTAIRAIDNVYIVPEHCRHSILIWVMEGRLGGHFLEAMLSNDLMKTFQYADGPNSRAMDSWTKYLYNYTPSGCWGSTEKVTEWANKGGIIGMAKVGK